MGILNKLMGYPDPDPTGRSRELFEKVGKQAMTIFFRGDVVRAFEHPQQLMNMVASKYGPYHPDIGRASLLGAVMMATVAQHENALDACNVALDILRKNEAVTKMDIEAAEFLRAGLERTMTGERPVEGADNYLISRETPVGKWLWQLKA